MNWWPRQDSSSVPDHRAHCERSKDVQIFMCNAWLVVSSSSLSVPGTWPGFSSVCAGYLNVRSSLPASWLTIRHLLVPTTLLTTAQLSRGRVITRPSVLTFWADKPRILRLSRCQKYHNNNNVTLASAGYHYHGVRMCDFLIVVYVDTYKISTLLWLESGEIPTDQVTSWPNLPTSVCIHWRTERLNTTRLLRWLKDLIMFHWEPPCGVGLINSKTEWHRYHYF